MRHGFEPRVTRIQIDQIAAGLPIPNVYHKAVSEPSGCEFGRFGGQEVVAQI